MLEYDWEDSVGYWICSATHAFRRAMSAELAPLGLTLRQWEVLAYLSVRGNGSQNEIAEGLGLEPQTLHSIIGRMEKAELIQRENCPNDRRKNVMTPTAKAEKVWAEVAPISRRVRSRAISELSKSQLQALKESCEKILHNLGEVESTSRNTGQTCSELATYDANSDTTEIPVLGATDPASRRT